MLSELKVLDNGTRFKEESRLELRFAYVDQNQAISAWPVSLTIQVCCYDPSQVNTMIDITIVWCIEISNIDGTPCWFTYTVFTDSCTIYDHEFTCLLISANPSPTFHSPSS